MRSKVSIGAKISTKVKEIKNSQKLKSLALILQHFYWYWIPSFIIITCYVKGCTLPVYLEHSFNTGLSPIGQSHSFYWFKCFFSYLVLRDILLHILVHNQLKPDDKRNDGAYDAFDGELCYEYWYDNSDIYCVSKVIW